MILFSSNVRLCSRAGAATERHRGARAHGAVPDSPAPSVCSCPGPEGDTSTSCSSSDAGALGVGAGGRIALLAARKMFSNPCSPRPSVGPELLGACATAAAAGSPARAANPLNNNHGDDDDSCVEEEGERADAEEEGEEDVVFGNEEAEKLAENAAGDQQHPNLRKSSSVFGQTQNLPVPSSSEGVKTCLSR